MSRVSGPGLGPTLAFFVAPASCRLEAGATKAGDARRYENFVAADRLRSFGYPRRKTSRWHFFEGRGWDGRGKGLPLRSVADGDGLHFEMAAAEDGSYADEFAGRQILGEITFIDGIEFVVVSEIGARNLDVDEIVHGEAGLRKKGF